MPVLLRALSPSAIAGRSGADRPFRRPAEGDDQRLADERRSFSPHRRMVERFALAPRRHLLRVDAVSPAGLASRSNPSFSVSLLGWRAWSGRYLAHSLSLVMAERHTTTLRAGYLSRESEIVPDQQLVSGHIVQPGGGARRAYRPALKASQWESAERARAASGSSAKTGTPDASATSRSARRRASVFSAPSERSTSTTRGASSPDWARTASRTSPPMTSTVWLAEVVKTGRFTCSTIAS